MRTRTFSAVLMLLILTANTPCGTAEQTSQVILRETGQTTVLENFNSLINIRPPPL